MRGFYVKSWQTAILCHPSSYATHKVILNLFQDLSAEKGQDKARGEMLK